jgi:hypothetical protein
MKHWEVSGTFPKREYDAVGKQQRGAAAKVMTTKARWLTQRCALKGDIRLIELLFFQLKINLSSLSLLASLSSLTEHYGFCTWSHVEVCPQ